MDQQISGILKEREGAPLQYQDNLPEPMPLARCARHFLRKICVRTDQGLRRHAPYFMPGGLIWLQYLAPSEDAERKAFSAPEKVTRANGRMPMPLRRQSSRLQLFPCFHTSTNQPQSERARDKSRRRFCPRRQAVRPREAT